MLWSIGQFPELRHLDPAQRKQVLRRVPWWTYPLMMVLSMMAGLPVAIAATLLLSNDSAATGIFIFLFTMALAGLCLYQYQLRRLRTAMRRAIQDGFAGQRPPFCFGCGYDLRGVRSDACPECGSPLAGGGGEA
jgi:hypothetical protein